MSCAHLPALRPPRSSRRRCRCRVRIGYGAPPPARRETALRTESRVVCCHAARPHENGIFVSGYRPMTRSVSSYPSGTRATATASSARGRAAASSCSRQRAIVARSSAVAACLLPHSGDLRHRERPCDRTWPAPRHGMPRRPAAHRQCSDRRAGRDNPSPAAPGRRAAPRHRRAHRSPQPAHAVTDIVLPRQQLDRGRRAVGIARRRTSRQAGRRGQASGARDAEAHGSPRHWSTKSRRRRRRATAASGTHDVRAVGAADRSGDPRKVRRHAPYYA